MNAGKSSYSASGGWLRLEHLCKASAKILASAFVVGSVVPALAAADAPTATEIISRTITDVFKQSERVAGPSRTTDAGDDTQAIQAALDTGRSVLLSGNSTYVVSRPLIMHSGQRLAGDGSGAVLKASPKWEYPVKAKNGYTLISNAGYAAQAIADHTMVVENITIDASGIVQGNGGFHGIGFRRARNIVVSNVICHNVGDCTAFEATLNTVVTNSSATGVTNVGFDHWEGPQNANVTSSTVYAAPGGDGVMFTAASGTPNTDGAGDSLTASKVRVYGPVLVGLTANILTPGGQLTNVKFEDCLVDVQNNANSSGVIITGNVTDSVIRNTDVLNVNGGQGIAVTPDKWRTPQRITIENARIRSARTSPRNVAPLVALGHGHKILNAVVDGDAYNYAVWVDDSRTQISGRFTNGQSGQVLRRSLSKQ